MSVLKTKADQNGADGALLALSAKTQGRGALQTLFLPIPNAVCNLITLEGGRFRSLIALFALLYSCMVP